VTAFFSKENQTRNGLRSIALFEAFKGLLVLISGFGLLAFVDGDLQALGENIIAHLHLNPAHHFPQIFIQSLVKIGNTNHVLIAIGAILYSTIRLLEAYGLWYDKNWAEWMAIISTGAYLPFEFYDIWEKQTAVRIGITVLNIALLIYLIFVRRAKMIGRLSRQRNKKTF
jgi:uncharacterized membrane protein (DUF2068 family)